MQNTILNPTYTFSSFIVDNSNIYAFEMAKTISKKPGIMYNFAFFYGDCGVGKTHLIQAIGNYSKAQGRVVIYTTMKQFIYEFIYSLKHQLIKKFREKYRRCDLLLIDNIEHISGKSQIQEEFIFTLYDLNTQGKQIVLTSNNQPRGIDGIDEKLQDCFEWGFIADIKLPMFTTKIIIELIKNIQKEKNQQIIIENIKNIVLREPSLAYLFSIGDEELVLRIIKTVNQIIKTEFYE